MATKGQKLTPAVIKKFKFLANSILNGKIPVKIDHSDRRTLRQIVSNKTHENDKKVVLVEDYRLHGCFKEALKIIQNNIKKENGGNSKQIATG